MENNSQQSLPTQKENKMGVMPVNRLLLTMSLPIALSMLVQALYNIVDSIFVAKVSESALTAVSLAFPFQTLMIAVGVGTAVGINALLSRSLGEKNFEEANSAANNGIFLAVISSAIFFVLGLLLSRVFFETQTADTEIIEYGTTYLTIVTCCSFGVFGQVIFERLLQSTGKTIYSMISQLIGAAINLILDPIMIFGYFGCPELGVAGAAIATVIGQVVAFGVAIFFNLRFNKELHLSIKGFRPNGSTIKKIYSIGAPSIIMQTLGSVMTFGLNNILMAFTSTATAVFGAYFKLQSFFFMPIFGFNGGLIPIVSYNYGARKKDRMTKAIKLAIIYSMSIMITGFFVFQFFPGQLLSLFDASDEMLAIGVVAFRIISISYFGVGFSFICITVMQALGKGLLSLIAMVIRQLGALLPSAYLLSLSGNVDLVWYSFPIAEVFAIVLCSIFMRKLYNDVIKPITPITNENDGIIIDKIQTDSI